jgi:hypothetical protein
MKWLHRILDKFKKECDCCWEERKIKKCPTKNCNFKMCDQCIGLYKEQVCPSCNQIRFKDKLVYMDERIAVYIDYYTGIVATEDGRILDIQIEDLIIYD